MRIILFAICIILNTSIPYSCNDLIEGEWIEADNGNILSLDGYKFYQINNSDTVYRGEFRRQVHSCNKAYADSTVKSDFLVFKYSGSEYCYEIMNLSDSILVYRNTINGTLYKYYKKGYSKPSFGPDPENN